MPSSTWTHPRRTAFLFPFVLLAALLVAGAVPATAQQLQATSSADVQQAPGYYHQTIGTLRVTALFDGVVRLPRAQIAGLTPAQVNALLSHRYVPESEAGLQTAVNAYLVQLQGGRLVLIDAGTADCFGAGLGHVVENLKAAGFQPEQVADVLLTHAHPDHLCGVLDSDGKRAFPNATLRVDGSEAAYWQGSEAETRTPKDLRFIVGQARRALDAYSSVGRLKTFTPGDGSLPGGIEAVKTRGHTPGHTSYLISGGAEAKDKLLVWGDLVHYHAVQFARPAASYEVDADRAEAIRARRAMLQRSAAEGWWVAGAHLPFPGLGHVRPEGKAYAWVPAEYSPLPKSAP
ncbi:MBL fold metallo-hydrolase [Variovorax sp.]|uniref:MBL fold metallo-hydrolase n=1 Tax=Variovorax sp. TaxID=1871043 RepID=UPI002D247E30|nr:MBL fold metallo-hydrolase [Variovorax sp.]HYP85026.1 MBL fold metallo-hydrolase [Variovorax sp.]